MKKINFSVLAFLFVTSCFFNSCSSDDSNNSPDYGITTGDYMPLTENNKWWYSKSDETYLVSIGGINLFDNVPYYRVNNSSHEYESWMNKKGASYFQKNGQVNLPLDNGTSLEISAYEILTLRDDLPIGGTWNGSFPLKVRLYHNGGSQNLPASLTYTGTILDRDATETIGNTTYTDIIKMKIHITQTVNSHITNIEIEGWFAKDIGLVKENLISSDENTPQTSYLTNYELH